MTIQEIEIPKEVKIVALPADWVSFEEIVYKGEPIIILKNRRIELNGGVIINLIPKGAFRVKVNDVRVIKYLTIDARQQEVQLKGSIVLERTDEKINNIPVFKVTQREPEVFLYGIFYNDLDDCKDIDILNTENIIQHYKTCLPNSDSVGIGIECIIQIGKRGIIDYVIKGKKHRDIILWNNGNPIDLFDIYEEPKDDEIF